MELFQLFEGEEGDEVEEVAMFIAPIPRPLYTEIVLPVDNSGLDTLDMEFGAVKTFYHVSDVRALDDTLVSIKYNVEVTKALLLEAQEAGIVPFLIPQGYLDRLKFLEVNWPMPAQGVAADGTPEVADGTPEVAADTPEEAADTPEEAADGPEEAADTPEEAADALAAP